MTHERRTYVLRTWHAPTHGSESFTKLCVYVCVRTASDSVNQTQARYQGREAEDTYRPTLRPRTICRNACQPTFPPRLSVSQLSHHIDQSSLGRTLTHTLLPPCPGGRTPLDAMPSPYGTRDVFRLGYGPPTSAVCSILEPLKPYLLRRPCPGSGMILHRRGCSTPPSMGLAAGPRARLPFVEGQRPSSPWG
jgi:hypothetical protein